MLDGHTARVGELRDEDGEGGMFRSATVGQSVCGGNGGGGGRER
jgi:hypothetical protein